MGEISREHDTTGNTKGNTMGFRYGNIDAREHIANKKLGNIGIIDFVQLKIAKEKPSRFRKEDDRIACQLFNKMATSLDRKAFKLAEHSSRIQRLEAEANKPLGMASPGGSARG
jgi:hypothetical protein